MPSAILLREFDYFLNHQEELTQKYKGRFLIIKDEQVVDHYASELEAVVNARAKYEPGTYIVQECQSGSEVYSMTLHSNVLIA